MANSKIEYMWRYKAKETAGALVPLAPTLQLVAGDLSGYTMSADELQKIAPADRWNGETPTLTIAAVGVTSNNIPKPLAPITGVTKVSALTAGQGLLFTIDLDNFVEPCAGFYVFVGLAAGQDRKLVGFVPYPSTIRNNGIHGSTLAIKIAAKPNDNMQTESELTARLAASSDVVYQCQAYKPDLGLGPGGITTNITPSTFESSTNGFSTTFNNETAWNIQLEVNPATQSQLEEILSLIGFDMVGEGLYNAGSPKSALPPINIIDFDLSPYIPTSTSNRVVILGVQRKSTDAAALQKAFNAKEPFTITLQVQLSDFVFPGNIVSYSRF